MARNDDRLYPFPPTIPVTGDEIVGGTIADARVASTLTRDAEAAAAYAALVHADWHALGGADPIWPSGLGGQNANVVEPVAAPMFSTNGAVVSGTVYHQFWKADRSPVLSKMLYNNRGVVASALTLARCGIYSFDGTTLTLVARTANDTTIGTTVNRESSPVFNTTGGYPATYTPTRGSWYSLAFILVGTPGNAPQCGGGMTIDMASRSALAPICRRQDSQSDLPTSVAFTSLQQNSSPFYIAAST